MTKILLGLLTVFISFSIKHINLPKNNEVVLGDTDQKVEVNQNVKTEVKQKIVVEINDEVTPNNSDGNFNDYIYPGSTLVDKSVDLMVIKTNDELEKVVTWYENVLRNKSKSTSFVKTKTNGKVNDVLAINGVKVNITGTEDDFEIKVELDKK